ncbi:hypothetical protein DCS_04022 [Drechmeria coniospora]|uniref:N-acetyltransferase domain-containing protein n=1 Tax=Drechmeria coniospora TaxID=98403 RepID=A0A151GIS0_DRECN|nr:hypothetical protein DCS_04022 [Drechmeria coniospora]KYK57015.1 hypothetical protein DCS_04022 [Drechmeria coniospora]
MPFRIRDARRSDVEAMAAIEVQSFHASPYHRVLFPGHLRIRPGLQDQLDWYGKRAANAFGQRRTRYIVAVAEEGEPEKDATVVAFAEWVAPALDAVAGPPSKPAAKTVVPACIDLEAAARCDSEIAELMQRAMPLFGTTSLDHMWSESPNSKPLNSIAVAEPYRSKGIGRMLTRWGIDAADAGQHGIWLVSAPSGRSMYASLGFRELAAGSRAGEGQYVMLREHSPRRSLRETAIDTHHAPSDTR